MTVLINGVEYVPRKKLNSIKPPGTFGQAIMALRKQQKLSLDAAAVAIGCSKSYLWALEHDASEPSLRMARDIANQYGAPLATLAACLGEKSCV